MKLKEIRIKNKITQTQVAKDLQMANSTYNGYEKGTSEPNIETIIKIANYFKVSVDELLGIEKKEDVTLTEKKALLKVIEELNELECHKLKIFADGLIANRIESNVRTIRLIKDED